MRFPTPLFARPQLQYPKAADRSDLLFSYQRVPSLTSAAGV